MKYPRSRALVAASYVGNPVLIRRYQSLLINRVVKNVSKGL